MFTWPWHTCHGRRKPGLTEIGQWPNRQLGNTQIALLEDPVEDVFVTNVEIPEGNRRVFEGIWELNDYFVQVVLETLGTRRAPQECRDLLLPAFALLKLSDCVAERVGLRRWHIESLTPKGTVRLAPATRVADRARAITFTDSELDALGNNREVLAPFILRDEDKQALAEESTGHSSLERRPLVDFGGELVLLHQGGHTVGEQLIQEIEVRNAKVSQGMIVDLNPATEPAEALVVGTQPSHRPGAANALNSGI